MADSDEDSDATYFYDSDQNNDTDSTNNSEESLDAFIVSDVIGYSEEEEEQGSSVEIEVNIFEDEQASDGSEVDTQNTASNDGTESEFEVSLEPRSSDDEQSNDPEDISEEETTSRQDYLRLRQRRPVIYYESPILSLEEEDNAESDSFSHDIDPNNDNEVAQEAEPVEIPFVEDIMDRATQRNETNSQPEIINNSNNESDEVVILEDTVQKPTANTPVKSQGEKRPLDDSFVDDGMTCSICLDSFTNSGPHRLSSLRCGHLFGQSCVERWLKVGCNAGARRCPTCNKKATIKDIRILYARKLVAIDTSELDKFKEELNKALLNKNVLDLEIQVCRLNQDMLKKEMETLKQQLEIAQKKAASVPDEINMSQNTSQRLAFEIKLVKVINVSNIGGCRVMAYDNYMNLVISTQSKLELFPGFCLRKFDVLEFRTAQIIPLHPKMIRDIAFHNSEKDLLLSVSLDATAKLLDMRCNASLNTYIGGSPLWSCCWDANNLNMFYTGAQSGIVSQFDTRNIRQAVNTWLPPGYERTPVVSLAGVPGFCRSLTQQPGFLSCSLNSLWACEQQDPVGWVEPRSLSIGGPFMSMSYKKETQLVLTSSRPNSRCPYTRHALNQISEDFRSCNLIHSIQGSSTASLMSRSCFVNPFSSNNCYVAAYNESALKLEMFDTASGQLSCSFPVNENIIDLCPVIVNRSCVLTALTDKKLMVYNFNSL